MQKAPVSLVRVQFPADRITGDSGPNGMESSEWARSAYSAWRVARLSGRVMEITKPTTVTGGESAAIFTPPARANKPLPDPQRPHDAGWFLFFISLKGISMLIISRNVNEIVVVEFEDGTTMALAIVEVRGGKVRLGLDAPEGVKIHRKEVWDVIQAEKASGSV